jgi:hypothetical protein
MENPDAGLVAQRWALRIPAASREKLGALRLIPTLTILSSNQENWIQGLGWSHELEQLVLSIPDAVRFNLDEDGCLTPVGNRVPNQQLPEGRWVNLQEYLRPELPRAAVSTPQIRKATWRLERSGKERTANLWLGRTKILMPYVNTAPGVRLKALQFALSADGRVIARGTPPPPLPGSLYVEDGGIAVPLGWELRPAAPAEFWRKVFSSEPGDLLLLEPDGSFERIQAAEFVPGSRGTLRACLEAATP